MNKHKTTKLILKENNIDNNILFIVKWLSSFQDVYTIYSCEKDGGYVIFYCSNIQTLKEIWLIKQDFANIKLDFHDDFKNIRFTLEFKSIKHRQDFIKSIKD